MNKKLVKSQIVVRKETNRRPKVHRFTIFLRKREPYLCATMRTFSAWKILPFVKKSLLTVDIFSFFSKGQAKMYYRFSELPFSAKFTHLSYPKRFFCSFSPGGLKKDRDGTQRYGCGDAGTPGVYSDVRHFRRTGWLDQAMSLTCH